MLRSCVMFSDEGALDALAFSVLAKSMFVNSIVKDASRRRLISLFHVSLAKLNAILEYGMKHDFFHFEGDNLFIHRLREPKTHKVNFDLEDGKEYTLRQIKDIIRALDCANQIKLQGDKYYRHAHRKPMDGSPEARRQQVKKRKSSSHIGFSMKKIAEMMRVSVSKAKVIMKWLLSMGYVRRAFHLVKTSIDPRNFCAKTVNAWYRSSGFFGYLLHGAGDSIACQVQNIYHVDTDKLHFRYEH